ncbi:MAG: hypothetical protein ACR2P8_11290 [Myxococcota bacterium]
MTSASSLPDEAFNPRPLRSLARIVVWPAVLLGIVAAMVWGDQHEQHDPVRWLLTLGLIHAVMLLER